MLGIHYSYRYCCADISEDNLCVMFSVSTENLCIMFKVNLNVTHISYRYTSAETCGQDDIIIFCYLWRYGSALVFT